MSQHTDEESEVLYLGKWLRLVKRGHWESCERVHGDGMAVLIMAVTPQDEVLFVEQFRVPLGKRTIEMPAGLVGDDDAADTLEAAAVRELEEETGWRPGKVDVLFDSLPSGLPHVKEGRLRALGITSLKRSPLLPDLPPVSDTIPGFDSVTWFGMYGPKGMPADLVNRINTAVNEALKDRDVLDRLARLGIEPAGGTPQEFAAMTNRDRAKWKKIIQDRKLTADQ